MTTSIRVGDFSKNLNIKVLAPHQEHLLIGKIEPGFLEILNPLPRCDWRIVKCALMKINAGGFEGFTIPKRNLKSYEPWNGISTAGIYDGSVDFDGLRHGPPFKCKLPYDQSWTMRGDEFISGKIDGLLSKIGLIFSGLPKSIGGLSQGECKPRDDKGCYDSKETVVSVNSSDNTDNVAADDFSDDEAVLLWLICGVVGVPIVYAFGKWSRKLLFERDKDGDQKQNTKCE